MFIKEGRPLAARNRRCSGMRRNREIIFWLKETDQVFFLYRSRSTYIKHFKSAECRFFFPAVAMTPYANVSITSFLRHILLRLCCNSCGPFRQEYSGAVIIIRRSPYSRAVVPVLPRVTRKISSMPYLQLLGSSYPASVTCKIVPR